LQLRPRLMIPEVHENAESRTIPHASNMRSSSHQTLYAFTTKRSVLFSCPPKRTCLTKTTQHWLLMIEKRSNRKEWPVSSTDNGGALRTKTDGKRFDLLLERHVLANGRYCLFFVGDPFQGTRLEYIYIYTIGLLLLERAY